MFAPHVMLKACPRWTPRTECDRTCIHRGRYCAVNAVPQQYRGKYVGAQARGQAAWLRLLLPPATSSRMLLCPVAVGEA